MARLSYEDSCRALQKAGLLEEGEIPAAPDHPPRYDDEDLGVEFFRTQLADASLEHLSLPRTFFGRSEIRNVSFQDTDLSESTLNWNDFINVDFGSADLTRCDFRASVLTRVNFRNSRLNGADFRHCSFTACDVAGADLTGAKLTKGCAASLNLSPQQKGAIDGQIDEGEEPEGG